MAHATLNPSTVALCGSSVSLRCWRLHSWVLWRKMERRLIPGPPQRLRTSLCPSLCPRGSQYHPTTPRHPPSTYEKNKKPLVTIEDYKGPFVARKFRKSLLYPTELRGRDLNLAHLRVDWKRRLRALCPYYACEACGRPPGGRHRP